MQNMQQMMNNIATNSIQYNHTSSIFNGNRDTWLASFVADEYNVVSIASDVSNLGYVKLKDELNDEFVDEFIIVSRLSKVKQNVAKKSSESLQSNSS